MYEEVMQENSTNPFCPVTVALEARYGYRLVHTNPAGLSTSPYPLASFASMLAVRCSECSQLHSVFLPAVKAVVFC